MEGLQEYADLATDSMKAAVKKAGNTVKTDITANAPERTGRYAKSWRAKTTKESATALEVTVYSPTRYMLAHLLEFGHAKRGGGRVAAKPHIAAAEQQGIEQLERDIERSLTHG
jgi:hypothetical protein